MASAAAKPIGKMGGTEYFEAKVRPLLIKHCYECHSEEENAQKGGLLLDRESGWLEGGDTGKAVVPGQVDASLLIEVVRRVDEDFAMPPKYALSEEEVDVLVRWVAAGAPGPAEDMGETEFSQLGDQEVIFEKAEEHWSFQPVTVVDPPQADLAAWNENPIDQFVFASLKENGLSPSPRAPARALVRRVSYSLTGLPPTDTELFELEYSELIERLLDSPRYGEHIARLWLDVARYADTASTYRADTKTPHYYPYAFTYRDYVIEAFHTDKPFDEFIREQLAADLLGLKEDAPELAALGFLGVSPHRSMSHDFVDDVIDATTRGLLGMTVSCARCHDHKFEPVPTADYYSLYGVFNSIQRPSPWVLDAYPKIEGYQPSAEVVADYEKKRAAIDKKIVEAGDKKRAGNNRSVKETIEQTELAELLLFHEGAPVRAMAVSEKKGKPVEPAVFIRGEPSNRGERVPRRFLEILEPEQKPFSSANSGRLDLADRVLSLDNPLTARVYVNRIWGMLMGDFLVDTPSDFGLQGEAPSHPELLDFLAAEFRKNGGSTKHLVRLIVSSQTYRQRSSLREDAAAVDPENELYWRANRKRLSVEELRDSLLAVSGELDLTMRGRPGPLWGEEHSKRRSIYGYVNRFNLDPTLRNFDFPSPMQTQGSRTDNIVPPQALFLMNSPFVIEQARKAVDSLGFDVGVNRVERITAIYEQILQRPPVENEIERIGRFADIEKGRKVNPWPHVAQALCMSNEFLYVD
ncbi:MAG: PSD1 and planctomycete cytochrome C domain-containing protein [Verrucomicrobiales bacterium]|nr:PSD1 and planctomycete cytochrome C domain-containing protein [Verrucomicrobiales bacterium]